MIVSIECPCCGHIDDYDDDNDILLCEECGELIFVPEEEELSSIERGD